MGTIAGMCPTLMRDLHDGSFFGMFRADTRVMGRFSGCCMGRLSVRCFMGLGKGRGDGGRGKAWAGMCRCGDHFHILLIIV